MKHFIHLPPSESRQSGMSVNIIQWFLNKTYLEKKNKEKKHTEVLALSRKKQWLSGVCANSGHSDVLASVYWLVKDGVTAPLRSMWVNTVNTVWGQIVPNKPRSLRHQCRANVYPLAGNPRSNIFCTKIQVENHDTLNISVKVRDIFELNKIHF